jgi:hypothetical protein
MMKAGAISKPPTSPPTLTTNMYRVMASAITDNDENVVIIVPPRHQLTCHQPVWLPFPVSTSHHLLPITVGAVTDDNDVIIVTPL